MKTTPEQAMALLNLSDDAWDALPQSIARALVNHAAAVALLQRFENAFGAAVDSGEGINGSDAVDWCADFLGDVRQFFKDAQS